MTIVPMPLVATRIACKNNAKACIMKYVAVLNACQRKHPGSG